VAQEQQEPTPQSRRLVWRRRWTLGLVLVAVGLAALTLFSAANYVHVEVRLIVWEGDVRVSWIGLGALAIGFVLGLLAGRLVR
jgi:uncharacterized integral membrane protein